MHAQHALARKSGAERHEPRESRMMAFQSETLTDEELATITGYQIPSKHIHWLVENRWEFVLTGARRPIVGRLYARMKLAGVKPVAGNVEAEVWTLDLSKVS